MGLCEFAPLKPCCVSLLTFLSMYGHIKTMAEAVKKAIDSVDGCEGVIYQVRDGGITNVSYLITLFTECSII